MHSGCVLKDCGILETQRRPRVNMFASLPQAGRPNDSLTFQCLLKGCFSVLPEFGEDYRWELQEIKPWNRGLLLECSTGRCVSLTLGWQIFVLANIESEETLNSFLVSINSLFTMRMCERCITKYKLLFPFSFEHHRMTQVSPYKVLAFVSTLLTPYLNTMVYGFTRRTGTRGEPVYLTEENTPVLPQFRHHETSEAHHHIAWRNTSQSTLKSFSSTVSEPVCFSSLLLLWVQILLELLEWRAEHELQEGNRSKSFLQSQHKVGWEVSMVFFLMLNNSVKTRTGVLSFGLNIPLLCSLCRSSLDWR